MQAGGGAGTEEAVTYLPPTSAADREETGCVYWHGDHWEVELHVPTKTARGGISDGSDGIDPTAMVAMGDALHSAAEYLRRQNAGPRAPLADLFGAAPEWCDGQDPVDFVREGRR